MHVSPGISVSLWLLLPGQQRCIRAGGPTPTARDNCSGSKLYGEGLIQDLELCVSFHDQRSATYSSVAPFGLDKITQK